MYDVVDNAASRTEAANGYAESVLLRKDDDALLAMANDLDSLADVDAAMLRRVHFAKAKIHTWLAWQEDPGTPMGSAVTKKYLTTTPPICQAFVNWLNALYN